MKNTSRLALSAVVIATLAACASRPVAPPELVSANDAVQRAQSAPNVMKNAPLELKKASDSLARANNLLAKDEPMSEVISTAYVAERQAMAAVALSNAKNNEDGLKSAEADRERARADAREREANRARGVAQTAQQNAALSQQNAAAAQQRAGMAESQAAAATAAAAAAQQSNAQLQQQAAQLQQQTAMLQRELEAMNAKKTERGMLVTLGDFLFEFGRADIKSSSMESLRKLAEFLKQHPERYVLIEGFTDSVGSASANDALSRRRAEAVANAMAGLGVAADKIKSAGYGEAYPIADNNTDSNRALNRRVEVYISDNDQPVQPRRG